MASKLQGTNLSDVLARWQAWDSPPPCRPAPVRRLGGDSNVNWLVRAENVDYVVRLNTDSAHLGVDRSRERMILSHIADYSWAPKVIHIETSCLITRHLSTTGGDANVTELAGILREIHTIGVDAPALSASEQIRSYIAHRTDWPAMISKLSARVLQALPEDCAVPVLCHNDLTPPNLIVHGAGLTIIDWEYSAPGDPRFDLAVILETHNWAPPTEARFLAQLNCPPELLQPYRDAAILVDLLWWLLVAPASAEAATRLTRARKRFASDGDYL